MEPALTELLSLISVATLKYKARLPKIFDIIASFNQRPGHRSHIMNFQTTFHKITRTDNFLTCTCNETGVPRKLH